MQKTGSEDSVKNVSVTLSMVSSPKRKPALRVYVPVQILDLAGMGKGTKCSCSVSGTDLTVERDDSGKQRFRGIGGKTANRFGFEIGAAKLGLNPTSFSSLAVECSIEDGKIVVNLPPALIGVSAVPVPESETKEVVSNRFVPVDVAPAVECVVVEAESVVSASEPVVVFSSAAEDADVPSTARVSTVAEEASVSVSDTGASDRREPLGVTVKAPEKGIFVRAASALYRLLVSGIKRMAAT